MKNILLLHGALSDHHQFDPLLTLLNADYKIHTLDFDGHGIQSANPESFSVEGFAKNVLDYFEEERIKSCSIFGYSLGGYIGLFLALHHPERIEKIITLNTKLDWNPESATKEAGYLDTAALELKAPAFANELKLKYSDWKGMMNKTAAFMIGMGKDCPIKEEDFKKIHRPVKYMASDRDKTAPVEETLKAYRNTAGAQLHVFSNTPHPFEKVDLNKLAEEINSFV